MVFQEQDQLIEKERFLGFLLLASIALFTILDVYEDLHEGSTLLHVSSEVLIIIACLSAAIYIRRKTISAWFSKTSTLSNQLSSAKAESLKWKEAHASISQGIAQVIDKQLEDWGLSLAEKEISLLLIKGLSFKEIATIRNTSEHTIRQQAATIYRKSGLEGRAQLSAYFLEDLFVPVNKL